MPNSLITVRRHQLFCYETTLLKTKLVTLIEHDITGSGKVSLTIYYNQTFENSLLEKHFKYVFIKNSFFVSQH